MLKPHLWSQEEHVDMVAVQILLMRGRLRGEQRGDRQVMPFDTIDPYDTPGRRLSLSLLQQHLVICISCF